jgi:hypothetical protein
MNDKHTVKLQTCEAALRRWHTRLTRATNMLQKLERQRRRLILQSAGASVTVQKAIEAHNDAKPDAGLDIPPFLQRKPVDVAALAAQRKSKEADAKKKMPLTGKAAIDYVKVKRKKTA